MKSNRIIGSIILIVAIILMATGVVYSYDHFWKITEKNIGNTYESRWFIEHLYSELYVNYMDIVERREGKVLKPSDIYLNVKEEDLEKKEKLEREEEPERDEESEKEESAVEETNNEADSENNNEISNKIIIGTDEDGNIVGTFPSIEVDDRSSLESFVKDFGYEFRELKRNYSYMDGLYYRIVDHIKDGTATPKEWEFNDSVEKDYFFYAKIVFDEVGGITVENSYGARKEIVEKHLKNMKEVYPYFISSEFEAYKNPIVNVTLYCGVLKNITPNIGIHSYTQFIFYEYSGFLFMVLGAMLLTMAIALILSGKRICGLGSGFVSKIWIEVIVGFDVLMGALVVAMSEIIYYTRTREIADFLVEMGITDKIILPLHVAAWSVVLGAGAVTILSIKQIFVKGLKRYMVENVFFIMIFYRLFRKIKRTFSKMAEIKLDDTVNKFLIRILSLNFIILALFCTIWVFGIVGLIVYTIVLFILLQKKFSKLKENYDSVVDITEQLASGNLNVAEEKDLGIFEPIKGNLSRIQEGFKKAVETEMKSQHMKTELITNVSHDLKTPLTAIITYINLLKEEGVTEEERISYIETLDMKSQRLKQLIEDLFEVSKANSGNMEVNLESMDVLSLIRQVELELAEKLEEAGIELSIRSNKEKVLLELDGQKSYRILENLFGNLVKYAMPDRKAYVDVIEKESTTLIEVKNISKEELDFDNSEITERFVRGDKSRNSEGTGLGLAIVKSLVELQGGRFEVVTDGDLFKAVITFVH